MSAVQRNHNRAATIGLRTISSLQNPVYRTFFFSMLGQFASISMQNITGSLLIYRLTDSSALLGTMSLASAIPMIIVSMFGGAVADRVQKKRILILGLICAALVATGIGVLLSTGYLSKEHAGSWWVLMLSSFLMGVIMGMTLPARQAIIPEIVSREQVMNAVSLNWLGMNVLTLIGPGIAGILIDSSGFAVVYYSMGALYLYAAIMMAFVTHTSPSSNRTGNIMEDIRQGFQYIRHDTIILFVLGFTLVMVVFATPYQQFLPIYVDDILKVGATGLGVLMMVSGIGSLAGSLFLTAIPMKKRGWIFLASGLVSGITLLLFSFSTHWGFSLVLIVFIGLSATMRGVISSALLQSYTKPEYMGRVMAIMMMQWGAMSLFTFFAGLMAEVMPVQWVLGSCAVVVFVLSLLALFTVPRLRKLD